MALLAIVFFLLPVSPAASGFAAASTYAPAGDASRLAPRSPNGAPESTYTPAGSASAAASAALRLSGTLRLAVAANFRAAFEELAREFEGGHGIALSPAYGSSGLLAAQIRQGAPFDAFFSADTARPDALVSDGLAIPPVTVYVRGRLALRTRGTSGASPSAGIRRIGIANPELAPYGAAAMQCLERLGVLDRLRVRLVFGNNVNQVNHFLESGALDLGFVALSQLVARNTPPESYWVCPAAFHAPIAQGAVILQRSGQTASSRALLRFMTEPATLARLERLGYLPGD